MKQSPVQSRPATSDGRAGFTLIELLVVVAIIAILAAMLLSALSGTKLQAQQAQCISNLKQLELAYNMYEEDNGKEIPSIEGLGYYIPWEILLRPYYGNTKALQLCPSASKLSTHIEGSLFGTFRGGTSDTAWTYIGNPLIQGYGGLVMDYGSYAFNGWLYDTASLGDWDPGFFQRPSAVHRTSWTPVFADSIAHDAQPSPYDRPATNLYLGGYDLGDMSALTIARHGSRPASAASRNVNITTRLPGAIDVALYDGHVEKSPLENLWNYGWSADWKIPNPRPGRWR